MKDIINIINYNYYEIENYIKNNNIVVDMISNNINFIEIFYNDLKINKEIDKILKPINNKICIESKILIKELIINNIVQKILFKYYKNDIQKINIDNKLRLLRLSELNSN